MTEWNDAITAAQAQLPKDAAALDALKRPVSSSDCLHPELTFDNGDYLIFCRKCNSRWVMTALGRESGTVNGQIVGGDISLANKGAAAGMSGEKRVKP